MYVHICLRGEGNMQAWCLCRKEKGKRTRMARKDVTGHNALTIKYGCPECDNEVEIELFEG